jgi:hypothetical protein
LSGLRIELLSVTSAGSPLMALKVSTEDTDDRASAWSHRANGHFKPHFLVLVGADSCSARLDRIVNNRIRPLLEKFGPSAGPRTMSLTGFTGAVIEGYHSFQCL